MLAFIGTRINVLVVGDTWVFRFNDDSDHPNTTWSAQIVFNKDGTQLLAKPGVADGGDFLFTVTAAETAALTKYGLMQVYVVFTSGAVRDALLAGDVTVVPNPTGTMVSTPNMLALAGVLSTITTILSQPEASASFNGQSYTLQNIQLLYDIRNHLILDVNTELRALGLTSRGTARRILMRFR